jgi:hypothetical protein
MLNLLKFTLPAAGAAPLHNILWLCSARQKTAMQVLCCSNICSIAAERAACAWRAAAR